MCGIKNLAPSARGEVFVLHFPGPLAQATTFRAFGVVALHCAPSARREVFVLHFPGPLAQAITFRAFGAHVPAALICPLSNLELDNVTRPDYSSR